MRRLKKKAEVLILLGQSNAVGHGIPMAERDVIREPLTHVFGLSRERNQTLYPTRLTFSGYLSAGMNLAEEQDDTYSLANCLAAQWEQAAEMDTDLPDLYIVQIAIGAQGVGPGYMWNPEYPEQLIPGKLGTVTISLFPYTRRILSLLKPTFAQLGVEYHILGIHWRGGENDTVTDRPEVMIPLLRPIYRQLFDMFRDSLGELPKTVLYQVACGMRNYERTDIENLDDMRVMIPALNEMFADFARENEAITLFHPFSLSLYDPDLPQTWGIFSEVDGVHYTGAANAEIAAGILAEATVS